MSTVVAEGRVLIGRPLEDVFSFASNPNNEPRWHTDILAVRPAAGSPAGGEMPHSWTRGSMWNVTVQFMGRMEGEVEVTAFEPNHRIEFTTRTGRLRPIATCLFEPADRATLVTRHVEIPLHGLSRVMKPMMQRMGTQRQQRFVENLKRILESAGDD